MAKTTKKDFDLFTDEGSYWIGRLNLNDWDICFIYDINENEEGLRAWARPDLISKTATIALTEDWMWLTPNKYDVCKSAFHECCEVMMHKLYHDLRRTFSENYVASMIHKVIRTLENTLFVDDWNRRNKKKGGK